MSWKDRRRYSRPEKPFEDAVIEYFIEDPIAQNDEDKISFLRSRHRSSLERLQKRIGWIKQPSTRKEPSLEDSERCKGLVYLSVRQTRY